MLRTPFFTAHFRRLLLYLRFNLLFITSFIFLKNVSSFLYIFSLSFIFFFFVVVCCCSLVPFRRSFLPFHQIFIRFLSLIKIVLTRAAITRKTLVSADDSDDKWHEGIRVCFYDNFIQLNLYLAFAKTGV